MPWTCLSQTALEKDSQRKRRKETGVEPWKEQEEAEYAEEKE